MIIPKISRIPISHVEKTLSQNSGTSKNLSFSIKKRFQKKEVQEKPKISVNLRILFDYMQMVTIIQKVQFQWPFYLEEYFNVFSYLSFTNQIFSLDCVYDDYQIPISMIYLKTIFIEIMPFLICFFAGIYFALCYRVGIVIHVRIRKKQKQHVL